MTFPTCKSGQMQLHTGIHESSNCQKHFFATTNCISSREGCPYSQVKSLFSCIHPNKPMGLTKEHHREIDRIGTGSTYFSGVYIQTVKEPKVKLPMRKSGNKFFSSSNLQQACSCCYSFIMEKCNKDFSSVSSSQ